MAQRRHIQFDDDLNQQIIDLARAEDRHFAWMVRTLLREAIAARRRVGAKNPGKKLETS